MIQLAIEHRVDHGDIADDSLGVESYVKSSIHDFCAVTPVEIMIHLIEVICFEVCQVSPVVVSILTWPGVRKSYEGAITEQ